MSQRHSTAIQRLPGSLPGCGVQGPLWRFGFAPPLVADDADRDGIPDPWERDYFGVLTAVNGATDRDGDGSKDWQEWTAGTNPTNHLDFFKVGTCRPGPMNPLLGLPSTVFEWPSVPGRTYSIYYAKELETPATVWTLLDQVAGTGGLISYTNAWPDPAAFYFLGVSTGP